jgi:hypothetical protein
MALDNFALEVAGDAIAAEMTHVRLHSADPGTGETSALGSGRVAAAFTSDSDGDITLNSAVAFTGLGASAAVAWVTVWDASTAGNRVGKFAVTGDAAANAAGEYTLTALTLTGTAS